MDCKHCGSTVPDAPTNLIATAHSASVELSWTAPTPTITDYEVSSDDGSTWIPLYDLIKARQKRRSQTMADKNNRPFGEKNPSYPHFICARDLIEMEMLGNSESWDDVVQIEHKSNQRAFKRFDDYVDANWLDFLFYDEPWNGTSHMMASFSVITHDHQYISSGNGNIVVM